MSALVTTFFDAKFGSQHLQNLYNNDLKNLREEKIKAIVSAVVGLSLVTIGASILIASSIGVIPHNLVFFSLILPLGISMVAIIGPSTIIIECIQAKKIRDLNVLVSDGPMTSDILLILAGEQEDFAWLLAAVSDQVFRSFLESINKMYNISQISKETNLHRHRIQLLSRENVIVRLGGKSETLDNQFLIDIYKQYISNLSEETTLESLLSNCLFLTTDREKELFKSAFNSKSNS